MKITAGQIELLDRLSSSRYTTCRGMYGYLLDSLQACERKRLVKRVTGIGYELTDSGRLILDGVRSERARARAEVSHD